MRRSPDARRSVERVSKHRSLHRTWTAGIARIDPPLWLGLELEPESPWNRFLGRPDVSVGHSGYAKKLRVHAQDPQRASMLLSAADDSGRRMLDDMLDTFRG